MASTGEMNGSRGDTSMVKRLIQDRKDHLFTDATIVWALNVFHVHSVVLTSMSPVFERMFRECPTKRLDLSHEPLDPLLHMINFMYDGQYDADKTLHLTMHIHMYGTAEKYQVDAFKRAIAVRVKNQIGKGIDTRFPIESVNGLRYNYWDDDDLVAAVRMLWYEGAPPYWALREPVLKGVLARKQNLLLDPMFRDLLRRGTDFVILVMCDGVVVIP